MSSIDSRNIVFSLSFPGRSLILSFTFCSPGTDFLKNHVCSLVKNLNIELLPLKLLVSLLDISTPRHHRWTAAFWVLAYLAVYTVSRSSVENVPRFSVRSEDKRLYHSDFIIYFVDCYWSIASEITHANVQFSLQTAYALSSISPVRAMCAESVRFLVRNSIQSESH